MSTIFPFLDWFKGYSISDFRSDAIGGITVALVLVPQSMAYAQLAGLPVYYGLYASFLPPMIASLFGSSRQLATGPVAIVSLMSAASLEPLATAGSESFIAYSILLALIVGLFQFALGALRLGLVVNFLSHPVVNGFTNAGALIIASSQLSKVFGVTVDKGEHHYETIYNVIRSALSYTHMPTLGLAVLSFVIMFGLRRINRRIPNVLVAVIVTTLIAWYTGLERDVETGISSIESSRVVEVVEEYNAELGTLAEKTERNIRLGEELQKVEKEHGHGSVEAVALRGEQAILRTEIENIKESTMQLRRTLRGFMFGRFPMHDGGSRFRLMSDRDGESDRDGRVWRLKVGTGPMDEQDITFIGGGAVVGRVPEGLPEMRMPAVRLDLMLRLLPMAMIISLLGFMEAISIAKAMAARTGQRLDPNQELIGQGLANIVGSFGQSYAVSGSFSRSAVNLQAGAVTGLSNVFSSAVVIVTLLFLTPLLYHLPQATLAAIIMMAVIGLVNVRGFIHAWKAQWYDGAISIITFVTTLLFAPHLDRGIFIGVVLSIILHMFRDMKPSIAMLAKHPDGTFRNRQRFGLAQCPHIALIRYEGSIIFANVNFLEESVMERVTAMPELKHILVVGNGVNELDASGEEMLSSLIAQLHDAGYEVSFSGLNDSVLDVMRRTGLYDLIGEQHFYRNATRAVNAIWDRAHRGSTEKKCPLLLPIESEEDFDADDFSILGFLMERKGREKRKSDSEQQ